MRYIVMPNVVRKLHIELLGFARHVYAVVVL